MKDRAKDTVKIWESVTRDIGQIFVEKYFDGTDDWDYVGDNPMDALFVREYFFGLDMIITALRYDCSFEKLIGYYDLMRDAYCYEGGEGRLNVNFENYVRFDLQPKIIKIEG